MTKLKNYQVFILRADNDFDKKVYVVKRMKLRKFNFIHRGHKYEFDPEKSFIIHEIESLSYWLMPDRVRRYDRLLLYKEPADPLHGIELPIPPLTVPSGNESIEESPAIVKGVTRSRLKHDYRKKQRFPTFYSIPWWLWVVLAVSVVFVIIVITTGGWSFGVPLPFR